MEVIHCPAGELQSNSAESGQAVFGNAVVWVASNGAVHEAQQSPMWSPSLAPIDAPYPPELGVSNSYSSSASLDGGTCLSINFPDPQNKFFTSVTLYDADGYLMEGNSYISSYAWRADADGTNTLHFNCDGDVSNSLTSGGQPFSYTIRNYGASQAVVDGKFRPVAPTPAKK